MHRECRERFHPPPISKETANWRSRYASRHVREARAVMHVGIAYLWRRGKRSRHSRRMRTRNFVYLARGPYSNWKCSETSHTVKPVCNHLYNKIHYLWFIQSCVLMKTEGTNLLVLTISAFWSSSSSRRQRNIPLGGRYRQVSLYLVLQRYSQWGRKSRI